MDLSDIKDSYVRKKELPFSSEQKWMAVKCSPKNEVSASWPLSTVSPPNQANADIREESLKFPAASVGFQIHENTVGSN